MGTGRAEGCRMVPGRQRRRHSDVGSGDGRELRRPDAAGTKSQPGRRVDARADLHSPASAVPGMTAPELATRLAPTLAPDPRRVIVKLFVPGEDAALVRTRASALVERIASLSEEETDR